MRVVRTFAALMFSVNLCANVVAADFSFGVFGDAPYTPAEARAVERVIDEMNREPLAFTVHVGDFKRGSSPCTEDVFRHARALLDLSDHPLIYLPGDNEWTDCHRAAAGGYDPIERLALLRRTFFNERLTRGRFNPDPPQIAITSQRDARDSACRECVENRWWWRDGVLFVALHVVGSNNNLGRTPAMTAEHRDRMRAVASWFDQALDEAQSRSARAMVVMVHGNPWLERTQPGRQVRGTDGFAAFRRQLARVAQQFARPMLFIHGDTHQFKVDRPLYDPDSGVRISNVVRAEVWGSPFINWLRVTVQPDQAEPFSIVPSIMQPLTE